LANFIKDLNSINTENNKTEFSLEIKTIGYSISNNIIPAIRYFNNNNKSKEIIFIVARQHPC
jgi:murein tripeptide amidase MpaA